MGRRAIAALYCTATPLVAATSSSRRLFRVRLCNGTGSCSRASRCRPKMGEQVLDEENWRREALAVINDIRDHVLAAEVSAGLRSSDQRIYLNLTTLEGERLCVELSGRGFRVVGRAHNAADLAGGRYFETPYSLLGQVSAGFCKSFGSALSSKLGALGRD